MVTLLALQYDLHTFKPTRSHHIHIVFNLLLMVLTATSTDSPGFSSRLGVYLPRKILPNDPERKTWSDYFNL